MDTRVNSAYDANLYEFRPTRTTCGVGTLYLAHPTAPPCDRNALLSKHVLTSGRAVESQVEFQHIDAWLAEETDQAVARIFGDELQEHIFR